MNDEHSKKSLKMMSRKEMEERGWVVPSYDQFSENMSRRLEKIRRSTGVNFFTRFNYNSNSNSHQS